MIAAVGWYPQISSFILEPGYRSVQKEKTWRKNVLVKAAPLDVVQVGLGDERSYPIYIGRDFFDNDFAASTLKSHIKGNTVLVITNDLVAPLHLETILGALRLNPGYTHP